MISRREFIKTAAATLLFAPAISNWKIWAEPCFSPETYLGRCMQEVQELTTLYKKLAPSTSSAQFLWEQGDAPIVRNELLSSSYALASNPRTLLFFGNISDAHIVDEESPARVVAGEAYLELVGVRSAFRPQEDLTLQVLNSMLQTFNNIVSRARLDFLLNSGDNVDNAQANELQWFLNTLEGGKIDPDSGKNEDPVPGPGNDANDPFVAAGLLKSIPCYGVIGNHDILLQGNVPISLRELYNSIVKHFLEFMVIQNPKGDYSNAVLTPWKEPPDPWELKPGKIVPDPRRAGVDGQKFIEMHLRYPSQRPLLGFPKELLGESYGYYSIIPKPGLPLRLIVLDSACRLGSALGMIDDVQYEEFLVPELEKAKANKELVIIASHHPSKDLVTLGGLREELIHRYGKNKTLRKLIQELVEQMATKNTYISRNTFQETLKSYPNVILHVAGHIHANTIQAIGEKGRGYWEVTTASLMDYPQQARLFELVDEGKGVVALHTAVVDHDSAPESLAARSRYLAYKDHNSAKSHKRTSSIFATGKRGDRNAILRVEIPKEIARRL